MASISETYVENTIRVRPKNSNNNNTTHAGKIVMWMDNAGELSTIRFSGNECVTAKFGEINFENPLNIGNIAKIKSYVYDSGKTSVNVYIEVSSKPHNENSYNIITESCFTYVAIDKDGNPVQVPELKITNEEEQNMQKKALNILSCI